MNEYIFSPGKNAFYPLSLQSEYEAAGTWPEDGVPVSVDVYTHFSDLPPDGKVRGVIDGMPAWVDIPPPTHEELVAIAEQKKKALLAEAVKATSMWRTELQLGIISDEDKAALTDWILYHRELQGIDTDTAPDIEWPDKPQPQ